NEPDGGAGGAVGATVGVVVLGTWVVADVVVRAATVVRTVVRGARVDGATEVEEAAVVAGARRVSDDARAGPELCSLAAAATTAITATTHAAAMTARPRLRERALRLGDDVDLSTVRVRRVVQHRPGAVRTEEQRDRAAG